MGIKYETAENVATIVLDNASRANVIDKAIALELAAAWKEAWEDRDVRCIVLTGSGSRHFCGGHDLKLRDGVSESEFEFLAMERLFRPPAGYVNGIPMGMDGEMGDHFPRIPKPVIAAVNGWAVGAGLYVLLASTDIRIAARGRAMFRFGLISRGWIGAGPGATLLAKQLRYADAMKMLLLDEAVDADEAVRIGLVNESVEPDALMDRAYAIAERIARHPPLAAQKIKEFVTTFSELPAGQAWRVQSLLNTLLLHMTEDGVEGRLSFLQGRDPDFTGEYSGTALSWYEMSEEQRRRISELKRQIDW